MRITVTGWGRNQGEKEIMNASLADAERELSGGRFDRDTTYVRVENPESRRFGNVHIQRHTEVRLGGDYLLHVELTREEIAQLFYQTHGNDIVRMFRSFIEDEERQENEGRIRKSQELVRKTLEAMRQSAHEQQAE